MSTVRPRCESPEQGRGYLRSPKCQKGQGLSYDDQRETLRRMEAISPGRWLDDIPPIQRAEPVTTIRYSGPAIVDYRRNSQGQTVSSSSYDRAPTRETFDSRSGGYSQQDSSRNRSRNNSGHQNSDSAYRRRSRGESAHGPESMSTNGGSESVNSSDYRFWGGSERYSPNGSPGLPLSTAIKVRTRNSARRHRVLP